jgi:hypothetical protein
METSEAELIDVVPGLWIWQVDYREWPRGQGWDGKVVSTCVESGGEIALLDPLAPENESSALWERLAARPPKFIVILKPDHMRDVDFFARRYNIRAFGPKVFHRDDIPETELEYIYPGIPYRAVLLLCTTDEIITRHPFGCRNSVRSFLLTR